MIFKSPHAPVTIPEISLTDYVLRRVEELGDKPALIDGPTGRTYTYSQLPGYIKRLAAGFAAHGVTKGDVLAIYSPNLPEYALAFHAVATLGAATTMVPPLFTDEEIIKQLKNSGAKYLLTIPQLMENARVVAQAIGIRKIFVIGEADGAISFASLLIGGDKTPDVQIDPREDVAALPYSSGTTGFPKGVMLTHRNLVAMMRLMEANHAFSQDDTIVCVVPMYHLYGLHIVVNLGLSQGATIVTVPRYDLEQFLQALEHYKVTVAPLVPPLVLALSRAPQLDQHDLSALRLIHCGAATLADSVASACSARLGCEIRYGYGLTEVSPLSHASLSDSSKHTPGSVGYCLPNTECRIVDYTTGAELGPNREGEIWIRGPQVMKGYASNEQATSEMINSEGWLRTGDIGYCDADGQLFVVDRLKELIKTNGRQVAPAELEALLLSHSAIADAAVIPSPDEKSGEVPKAFVVLKTEASAEEIMEFVSARVAPYKRIKRVEFVSEIPKSPAGKILRRVLKERERRSVSHQK
ncbi:MAG TPA: 4-coumarate--CoA ligase family protein [Blastocatellia bacterium]|jgi:acyl-CoA synthetase (AMP-forming)/AMP-acid ligase II|nr:4-coumarate--CoA ligase family protein [Blastocatellia bacterium]HAF23411.1 4-coumarate--CoA ligase family protein [Blastocatellia bacterium]HCX29157.1 4-coumarate--CoA ligase family protein [Blastocatellia bacterium]